MKKNESELPTILKIYRQAIVGVPFLKYSSVLVVTCCIVALIGYFKLDNATVFLYAFGVIILSFLCFAFSLFLRNNDPFIRFLRYSLVTSITITSVVAILGLAFFIVWQKPTFYKRWLPDQRISKSDTTKTTVTGLDAFEKMPRQPRMVKSKKIRVHANKQFLLSIQLKEETEGYCKIFIDGKQIPILAESTRLNPRIEIVDNLLNKKMMIVTNNGDTCISLLPSHIDTSLNRYLPNCN